MTRVLGIDITYTVEDIINCIIKNNDSADSISPSLSIDELKHSIISKLEKVDSANLSPEEFEKV